MTAQNKLWLTYLRGGGHASNMDVASSVCLLAPSTDPPALSMKAWRSDAGTLSMFLILVSKELRTSSDPLSCRGVGGTVNCCSMQDSCS